MLSVGALGAVESLVISDNGHGIPYGEADAAFSNLGGSWKNSERVTKRRKRPLHGKAGQGRFSVFSLGSGARWETHYSDCDAYFAFSVKGSASSLGTFQLSALPATNDKRMGTTVTIDNISSRASTQLLSDGAVDQLSDCFAIYLMSYPDIDIYYNEHKLDPIAAVETSTEYDLVPIDIEEGGSITAKLQIIEWKTDKQRFLHLCDEAGLSLMQTSPGIQAPGFSFAAYVKSDFVRQMYDNDLLMLEDIHPDTAQLINQAKDKLREHFRAKASQNAAAVVEEWKQNNIYPYVGPAMSIVEEAERQVFDVVALNVNTYLPGFEESDKKSKQFSFRLLKEVLTESPEAMRRIVNEVLELSPEKLDELADLIEKTSLAAIINASKLVADRLEFLSGLETLVFDPDVKKFVRERAHLQKILEEQTWIFGEEFHLSVPDRSLNEVLVKHYELLGEPLEDNSDVVRPDGKKGIVDLMLSRKIPQPDVTQLVHLVVELKKPAQKIDSKAATQMKQYAMAIAKDERFRHLQTQWIFWVLSSDMDDVVKEECRQPNRPEGVLFEHGELKLKIWTRTWSELILNCRSRLEFFRKELGDYTPDKEAGLEYLRRLHAKYLPIEILDSTVGRDRIERESVSPKEAAQIVNES